MDQTLKLKLVLHGAGLVFICTIFSKIFSYLYRIIVARYLGPETYGLLSLGFAIISFAKLLSVVGLNIGVMRYVAYFKGQKNYERIRAVIISSVQIVFPISFIFFLGFMLFSEPFSEKLFHNRSLSIILKVMAFTIPLMALTHIFHAIFRAFHQIKYEMYAQNIVETIFNFFITLILILFGFKVLGIVAAYLISVVANFSLSLYFLEKNVLPMFREKIKTTFSNKDLLGYSLPLLFTGFLYQILDWTDTLMISNMRSVVQTGIYNAAIPIAYLMYFVPNSLLAIFMPTITELYAQRKYKPLEKVFSGTTKWVIILNIPVFLILTILSKEILILCYGTNYANAAFALTILSFGGMIFSFSMSYTDYLKMIKRTKLIFLNTLLVLTLNILLNYFLIKKYGIYGAAAATAISMVIYSVLTIVEVRVIAKIKIFYMNYAKVFVSAAVAFVFVYFTKSLNTGVLMTFLVSGCFFLLVYTTILLMLGVMDEEDFEIIMAIKKKLMGND